MAARGVRAPGPGKCNRVDHVLRRTAWAVAALSAAMWLSGCAAFHPMHGVPARYLPEEFRGFSRADQRTIDLSLLKQTPPSAYRVDTGDVLGIYIEGVLGDRRLPQPVNIPLNNETPPTFGYPIPVRDGGTISLPLIGTQTVKGLTIAEVENLLKDAYTKNKQFLNPDNDRILVSLQRPRQYRVLVIRQEEGQVAQPTMPGFLNMGTLKRGTGQVVSLAAYRNDVLHALAHTGGLPGLDAENAIYVIRQRKSATGWTPPSPAPPSPQTGSALRKRKMPLLFRAQSLDWGTGHSSPALNPHGDYRRGGFTPVEPVQTPPQLPTHQLLPVESPAATSPVMNRIPINTMLSPESAAPQTVPSMPVLNPALPSSLPVMSLPRTATELGGNPHPLPDRLATHHQEQVPPPPPLVPTPDGQHLPPDQLPTMTPEEFGWDLNDGGLEGRHIVRIPIRLGPGQTVDLQESDIILEDGDIVFIESRDTEVFYTGGLLSSGQYTLPRDYDLNVLEAIAISQARFGGNTGASRATTSVGGQSALNNDVSVSASNIIILRYLADGRMVPIEVDLYKARSDIAEQVIIQPGDYILLQYKKSEAIAAFFERHLLETALFGVAAAQWTTNNR